MQDDTAVEVATTVTYSWRFGNDVSSTPSRRGTVSSRRSSPRRTARCIIPSTSFQVRSNCRATAERLASCSQSITSASNSAVNPDPGSDHGTASVLTPCSGQPTRGTSAARIVLYWHVGRWRHRRSRVS